MGKLLILCGIARSGKSTFVKNYIKSKNNCVVVNADRIRVLLHGERFLPSREKEVHTITEIMVKSLYEQEVEILIDETNTTVSSIRKWLRIDINAKVIYLDTSLQECERRARDTQQFDLIEKGVLVRMQDNLIKLAKFGDSCGIPTQENIMAAVEKIRKEVLFETQSVV